MEAIRTHVNTLCELKVAQDRLQLLKDEKEELYQMYVGVKSPSLQEKVQTTIEVDKMSLYLYQLSKIRENGMSLEDEIEYQTNICNRLRYYLKRMEYNINKLQGIPLEIYKMIVLEGMDSTKAVKTISEEYCIDLRNVWRTYYSKIKSEIAILKRYKIK